MKTLRISALGAVVALALACNAQAVAVTTTFDSILNIGNDTPGGSTVGGFAGPFGDVNVSLTGQVATITFTGLNGFQFGDGSSVGVNVNSSSFTPAIISDADFKQFTSGNVDGLGSFNLVIDNNNFSTGFNTISFSVTNTGTPWATAANVLAFNGQTMNGGPFDAEAHVRQSVGNPNGLTGFAGENGQATAPDGGTTVMLLGSALGALGLIRRFIKA